jgi:hypothetical protein
MATAATTGQEKTTERPVYIIVEAYEDLRVLERNVNQKIREGYTPVGGIHSEPDYSRLYQAMISTNVKSGGRRKTYRRKTIA